MAIKFIFRIPKEAHDKYGDEIRGRFGWSAIIHDYNSSAGVGYNITADTYDDMCFVRNYFCKFSRYYWIVLKRVEGNIMTCYWTYYLTSSGGIRRRRGFSDEGGDSDLWWYPYNKIRHLPIQDRDPMLGLYLQCAPAEKDPNIKDQPVPVRYTIKFYLIDDDLSWDFLNKVIKFLDEHNLYYTTRRTFNRHICVNIFNISEMCKDKIMGAIEYAKGQGWTKDGGVEVTVSLDPVIANHKIDESVVKYSRNDVLYIQNTDKTTSKEVNKVMPKNFEKVVVSGPATIAWIYGKKVMVKKSEEDPYDYEKAMLALMVKSFFGDEARFHRWCRDNMKLINKAVEKDAKISASKTSKKHPKAEEKPTHKPNRHDRWTRKELDFLLANYKNMTNKAIGEALGRSYASVQTQLFRLHLKR